MISLAEDELTDELTFLCFGKTFGNSGRRIKETEELFLFQ